jgi:hypothetical protein
VASLTTGKILLPWPGSGFASRMHFALVSGPWKVEVETGMWLVMIVVGFARSVASVCHSIVAVPGREKVDIESRRAV